MIQDIGGADEWEVVVAVVVFVAVVVVAPLVVALAAADVVVFVAVDDVVVAEDILVIVTGAAATFQLQIVWAKNGSLIWQPVQFGGFIPAAAPAAAAGKTRNENFVCLHSGLISASSCYFAHCCNLHDSNETLKK